MSKSNLNIGDSIDSIRTQLSIYGNQIQEYLKDANATVEDYKFSIEKKDNGGVLIDIEFKASIRGSST